MKRNSEKPIYNYIIYILILLIIILTIIVLTSNNKKINEIQVTPTPKPSVLTMTLNGEQTVTVIKNQPYQDLGCKAYDTNDGDLTNKIIVENSVDTSTVGSYIIKYKVTNNNGESKEQTRIVNVIEDLSIEIDYSPKELTNKDVTITLKISGDCLSYTIDPDGHKNMYKNIEYIASSNNEYHFSVYRNDGKIIEKSIKIDNIDKEKPTGTCNNTITDKTVIEVNAKDNNGVNKYDYHYNNQNVSLTSNTHTVNEMISNVSVTIYDKAGNQEEINCHKIDNSWPIIAEQPYVDHPANNYNQTLKYNKLNYIIYYPDNLDLTQKNALVIFLHGLDEFSGGITMTVTSSCAFTSNMKSGRFQQRAIFLAPQCKSKRAKWTDCFDDLKGLIDETIKKYNVDTKRISMSGHSLGGEAVFNFIVKYPGFLAAAAPLAPSRINSDYTKMKDLKIAVFTGTKDGLFKGSQYGSNKLIQNGVNLKFYPLENVSHSSQKALFNRTNVIDWLVSQSK